MEEKELTKEVSATEQANELLHMILDLKEGKENVDLYQMQSIVLNMHNEIMSLSHRVELLEQQIENSKRKTLEVPRFMFEKRAQ